MAFDGIGDHWAQWLERKFEKLEVCQAVFNLASDKAPSPDRFPLAFFQRFLVMLKKDILVFMNEFHERDRLSKGVGTTFIALILKKSGEIGIRD